MTENISNNHINTSPAVQIYDRVEELNHSLKVSQLIVHKIFYNFNAGNRCATILILTHPASSIYTMEEAPLSRGDSPKKPTTEA
jgi:hypothetical protein